MKAVNFVCLQEPSAHDGHAPLSPGKLKSIGIVAEMKERVTQQPRASLQRVYNDVVQQAVQDNGEIADADELASSVPTFRSCRMTLLRARQKNEPPLPKQRAEIQLPEELTTMPDGRLFLQASDGEDDKILVFATDHALARTCSKQTIFVDGTFYTCPRLFLVNCLPFMWRSMERFSPRFLLSCQTRHR